jgi:RNA polymerase sigma-70 factor, ECF subfamily
VTNPDPTAEDAELVSRARSGDRVALEALAEKHHGTVYRFLLSRTRDEERAADLTQDAFVKAFRGLSSFRGDATFRTWVLAIATNELRAGYRKTERRAEVALQQASNLAHPDEPPDVGVIRKAEIQRIRRALDGLPEKQRLSVSLRLFDGLSFREVGAATGSTEGAARVNFFHGVRRLREMLDEDGVH